MTNNLEKRFINRDEQTNTDKRSLKGYAIVFDQPSEWLGDYYEVIPSDCFIKFDDCRALWNHNTDTPIGAVLSDTLQIKRDSRGIYFDISPDRLSEAQLKTIELGEARMSFGFKTVQDEFKTVNGERYRYLRSIIVHEISPVIFPAYSATNVEFRSLEDGEGEGVSEYLTEDDVEIVQNEDRSNFELLKLKLRMLSSLSDSLPRGK